MGVVADLLLDLAIMFLKEVESKADCTTFVVPGETSLVLATGVNQYACGLVLFNLLGTRLNGGKA